MLAVQILSAMLLGVIFAQWEIQIEGKRGWAADLPCWRKEKGWVVRLLGGRPLTLVGRTRYQAPEVDGVVFVKADGAGRKALHSIREVEITGADVYDLRGVFVTAARRTKRESAAGRRAVRSSR